VKSPGSRISTSLAKIARDNVEGAARQRPGQGPRRRGDEAEDIAAFHKAIGVPDDPKGYKLPVLKDEAGNDIPMNSDKLEAIAAIAHKNGIPARRSRPRCRRSQEADALEFSPISRGRSSAGPRRTLKSGAPSAAEKSAAIG
jgi:hypothetical protein